MPLSDNVANFKVVSILLKTNPTASQIDHINSTLLSGTLYKRFDIEGGSNLWFSDDDSEM